MKDADVTSTSPQTIAFTDGASSGNPGPSGWGSVIIRGNRVREIGGHFPLSTNNHMELLSVVETLKQIDTSVRIYSDSTYVLIGVQRWLAGWKRRGYKNSKGEEIKNRDLWREIDQLVQNYPHAIEWRYIPGHQGHTGNERADEIAVSFSTTRSFDLYSGAIESHPEYPFVDPPFFEIPEPKFQNGQSTKPKVMHYLVLAENREIKRFSTWSECESYVKGRAGVRFKKVHSVDEEKAVLAGWGM